MARLPIPGDDHGTWGDILNEYLSQSLKSDGTIQDDVVTASALAPNSVTNTAIAPNTITATEIASDTITAAVIADGSITEMLLHADVQAKLNATDSAVNAVDILDSTATGRSVITAVDAAAARTAIGAGTSNLAIGTTGSTAKAGDYTPTKADVGLGNVDNTSDASKNSASATLTNKTLTNPKINAVHDTSSNVLVDLVTISSAVNHVYITNQSTGNYPTIGVDGADTNIGLALAPKGNGPINLFGNAPTIAAAGGANGGNLNLNLKSQGTGVVQANDIPVVTTTGTQTLTNKTISLTSNTVTGIPYDLSVVGFGMVTTRATGTGDFPFGIRLQRACTLTSVTYRCHTADASGNLVVEIRKNGVAVSGSSATIASANQVTGGTSTGSWSFAQGDILTVYVTAVGTTPGVGLTADITGVTA